MFRFAVRHNVGCVSKLKSSKSFRSNGRYLQTLIQNKQSHFHRHKKKYGFLVLGSIGLCIFLWNRSEIVRFSRTFITVSHVMLLYRSFNRKYRARMKEYMNEKKDWDWDDPFMVEYYKERSHVHQQSADLLLALCLLNRGAYVKAGQYLASLVYALPREYTDTLAILQDQAPTHTWMESVQIFKEHFGKHPDDMFINFDKDPIASASIAQVHVAYLKDTKEKVAVKIQHPALERIFKEDVRTMTIMLKIAKTLFDFPFSWAMPEFKSMLESELDFINEGINCERTEYMFEDNPQIIVPKIHWNLTARKVLTMDFLSGCKVDDLTRLAEMGVSPKDVAKMLVECFSVQTFLYGIIHADLHPGNLHVRYNSKLGKPQLIVLDHGCYKVLEDETRMDYARLWKSIVFREHDQLKYYTGKFGIDPAFYQLFGLFLTFSNFLDSSQTGIIDQRRQMSKEELKKMWKDLQDKYFSKNPNANITDHFSVIENMFQGMKLDLILLLRTNIQLRSMTSALGKPINRFGIMAEYCIKAVEYETVPIKREIILVDGNRKVIELNAIRLNERTWSQKLRLQWQLLQLKMRLSLLNVAFWLANKLSTGTIFARFLEYVRKEETGGTLDDALARNAE